jgi:hypothetical protein
MHAEVAWSGSSKAKREFGKPWGCPLTDDAMRKS